MEEKENKKIKGWKSLADQLQVQLGQGAEEAKEEFETQKKNLTTWLDSLSGKIEEAKEISTEKAQELKIKWEELHLQAALAKAESKDEFADQQKNIASGIHQFKHELSQTYGEFKNKGEDIQENAEDTLEDFQTRFDLFKLQLHLGKEEKEEDWEHKKKNLGDRLSQLKDRLKTEKEEIEDNWDEFNKDISERWNQIRDAD